MLPLSCPIFVFANDQISSLPTISLQATSKTDNAHLAYKVSTASSATRTHTWQSKT
ncbi:outer membrane receptor domain protein [Acinetobacter sp. 983759]|nr:outer membrane receptor domain protein [Acinetobacter sp. 983759]